MVNGRRPSVYEFYRQYLRDFCAFLFCGIFRNAPVAAHSGTERVHILVFGSDLRLVLSAGGPAFVLSCGPRPVWRRSAVADSQPRTEEADPFRIDRSFAGGAGGL